MSMDYKFILKIDNVIFLYLYTSPPLCYSHIIIQLLIWQTRISIGQQILYKNDSS